MAPSIYVTAYGTRLVPRVPFVLSFRPPKFLVEHRGMAVAFGPTEDGLGASPLGEVTVEDVMLDIAEYPRVAMISLHTEDFSVPIGTRATIASSGEEAGWPFEIRLEDGTDPDEMIHIRGPLARLPDLTKAPETMRAVEEGRIDKKSGSATWKEWEYVHEGRPWRQRLYAVALLSTRRLGVERPFAVTAQCPAERRGGLSSLADQLVTELGSAL